MEAKIYNKEGKESGKIKLSEKVFGLPWNADMVHQVVTSLKSNQRTSIAHTKNRGEVRGGGKKPWKQKGTGRARHGSSRSPIWVGGGVTHGPRNDKSYQKKVNKKTALKALATILSAKFKDGEIIFIDKLFYNSPKTKEAKAFVKNISAVKGFEKLASKKKNAAIISTLSKDKNVEKSFSNFKSFSVSELRNLNILDIVSNTFLIIENPEKSLELIEKRIVKA